MIGSKDVSVSLGEARYPDKPPYSPTTAYPEYAFGPPDCDGGTNEAYAGVRRALALLELDAAHFDTPLWNPLGSSVSPGDMVVIKPNFVRNFRESCPDHGDCVVAHGAVLRAVVDYVYIALQGRGRIVVADASHSDADFDELLKIAGTKQLQAFYRDRAGFDLEVYDLRPERADKVDGVIVGHVPLPGDPAGYVKVNLGRHSAFHEINELCHLLYGSEYDTSELHAHQHDDIHEYLISKTVLDADCVIGLPKLKTHKKVGLTVNMKNLVGINGNKNWLPHHREGTPSQGGDQFSDDGMKSRLERSAVAGFKKVFPRLGALRPVVAGPIKAIGKKVFGDTNVNRIRSGNWYGNDTTWRTVLDLNRILHYADSAGGWHDQPVRKFFSVVDGIVGGEGNGPMDPIPKPVGAILAGDNPVAVDLAAARLMGFDGSKIPMLSHAFEQHPYPLASFSIDEVRIHSDAEAYHRLLSEIQGPAFSFQPHFGWAGHIEW